MIHFAADHQWKFQRFTKGAAKGPTNTSPLLEAARRYLLRMFLVPFRSALTPLPYWEHFIVLANEEYLHN
jgi:hypothetical protein